MCFDFFTLGQQFRTIISGDRRRPRNWSTTALSISAAGMRRIGHAVSVAPAYAATG